MSGAADRAQRLRMPKVRPDGLFDVTVTFLEMAARPARPCGQPHGPFALAVLHTSRCDAAAGGGERARFLEYIMFLQI